VILDGVVGAPDERLGNLRPPVAELVVGDDELAVLLARPLLALDLGVEVVVPSLAALLSDAAGKLMRDFGPLLRAKLADELDDLIVLLLGPRALDELGVEDLLPAVEALDVRALLEILGCWGLAGRGRGARVSSKLFKVFQACAGAFESHRVPWGVWRARTDLLPVLALVLRHGAAEDVVLLESRGSGDGQRYAGGAAGGRSKSRLSLKKSTLWAIFAGPRRRPETDGVGTPRGIFAGFDRAADVFDTHHDYPRRE
tara:strand:- start:533 stop:1300 length:768 start_codon:yes stop_codon:yes gene_type:complete